MEKILPSVIAGMLLCRLVYGDPMEDPQKRLKMIKDKAWKASVSEPKKNFNLDPQSLAKAKKEGIEIPYPPDQVKLDAQEAEDF